MRLKILKSGSSGNGFILHNAKTALIIEAGVKLMEVKKALNFNISKIAGVIVSHGHADHARYANEYFKNGIRVYAPEPMGYFSLLDGMEFSLGEFKIKSFALKHDVESYGFLIRHPEMGICVFIIDTQYSPKKFPGMNQLILEVNYSLDILEENIASGRVPKIVRDRVINSHMSLETACNLLKANDLSQLNNLVLCHLSDSNSDAARFKSEIEGLTGKRVTIAEAGIEIEFNKEF